MFQVGLVGWLYSLKTTRWRGQPDVKTQQRKIIKNKNKNRKCVVVVVAALNEENKIKTRLQAMR